MIHNFALYLNCVLLVSLFVGIIYQLDKELNDD
jgi:hypothetical protein